jgi:hypothetical protein
MFVIINLYLSQLAKKACCEQGGKCMEIILQHYMRRKRIILHQQFVRYCFIIQNYAADYYHNYSDWSKAFSDLQMHLS